MEAIQPIVLVGGRSTRFGRDKLREPLGDGWLIDAPIRALREVFGSPITAVGECDPEVAARFDRIIPDLHPGAGPIGGIISALKGLRGAVFVLAGDLPRITPGVVRAVTGAAETNPWAWAVMAQGARSKVEPCVALYRPAALTPLSQRLDSGNASLHDALPPDHLALVEVSAAALANVNAPKDL